MCALDQVHIDNLRWQRVIKQDSDIINVSLKTSIRSNNLGHMCCQTKVNRASWSWIDVFSSHHCDMKEFAGLTTKSIMSPFHPGSSRVKVLLFCSTILFNGLMWIRRQCSAASLCQSGCFETSSREIPFFPCTFSTFVDRLIYLPHELPLYRASIAQPLWKTPSFSKFHNGSHVRTQWHNLQVRPWPIIAEDASSVHRSPERRGKRNA